jgi:2-iminobutanoate/2-iminopropanoate deaminase
MSITRLNPDTLHQNPVFTQVVVVNHPSRTIYVGGQNGVSIDGKVVGADIASQSEQTYKNVIAALGAAGATLRDVVKMTIYIVQGQSLLEAFAATQPLQDRSAPPPTVSVIMVAGLANPEFLIEIEAVAAISTGAE